uniref:Uncharacterized protein n=1 Tax=Cacopsylla melanoneura TaxID=428564 RepID=A0A8D8WIQ4_9HEMI
MEPLLDFFVINFALFQLISSILLPQLFMLPHSSSVVLITCPSLLQRVRSIIHFCRRVSAKHPLFITSFRICLGFFLYTQLFRHLSVKSRTKVGLSQLLVHVSLILSGVF